MIKNLNNKGFSLVEVMAGFSLLVVIMVTIVKTIKLASELTTAAVDAKTSTLSFYEKYYNDRNYPSPEKADKLSFRSSSDSSNPSDISKGIYVELNKDLGEAKKCNIYVKEVKMIASPPDNQWEFEDLEITDISKPKEYELKDVRLKKIENIRDTSIARIRVDRYVKIQP